MLKGFFDSIPRELEDASEIDGCSRIGFIYRVLLPLAGPGILVNIQCFASSRPGTNSSSAMS